MKLRLNQEDSAAVAVAVLVAGDRLGHPATKGLAAEAVRDLAVAVNPAVAAVSLVAAAVSLVVDEGGVAAEVDSVEPTTVRR